MSQRFSATLVLSIGFSCFALTSQAWAGKYSSGSGRSYSSSSGRSSSGTRSTSSSKPSSTFSSSRGTSSSSNKPKTSYSSNTSSRSTVSPSPSSSKAKVSSTFDSAARKAKSSSSTSSSSGYPTFKSNSNSAPRKTYTSPATPTASRSFSTNNSALSSAARRVSSMGHLFSNAIANYAERPRVLYRDRYGSPFWWWLLDQPQQSRATWLYHHQTDIDPARRTALVTADPDLEAAVKRISGTPPNGEYVPPTMTLEDTIAESPLAPLAEAEPLAAVRTTYTSRLNSSPRPPIASATSNITFWITFCGGSLTLLWLVFIKRWQVALT